MKRKMMGWSKKRYSPGLEFEQHFERKLKQLQAMELLQYDRLKIDKKIDKKGKLVYTKKEHSDFIVLSPWGITWRIDTKECSADKFYFRKKIKHQVDAMLLAQRLGHRAGFLVWFKNLGPADRFQRFIEVFHQPATVESGVAFKLEMLYEKGQK